MLGPALPVGPAGAPGGVGLLLRYLGAILFLATGAGVAWYNGSHASSVIVLPFLADLVPGLRDQPLALGQATAALFAGVGLTLGLVRLLLDLRNRRA
jgi:hypothetical protein